MAPNTIGLTIIPSNSPRRIHSLFSGSNASGLASANAAKIIANPAKSQTILSMPFMEKYTNATVNTPAKNNPNFLLDGSFTAERSISGGTII